MKFLIAIFALVAVASAKQLTPQEFTVALAAAGVNDPQDQAIWNCIVEHVSSYRTTAKVDGPYSSDFGIFQISNAFWCHPKGNECGVACTALLDDDIADDISCALKIKSIHGFQGWQAYNAYCQDV